MYMIIISNMHAQSCVCVFLLAENRKKFEQTTTVCLRFIERASIIGAERQNAGMSAFEFSEVAIEP